jgi:hypothetical protein
MESGEHYRKYTIRGNRIEPGGKDLYSRVTSDNTPVFVRSDPFVETRQISEADVAIRGQAIARRPQRGQLLGVLLHDHWNYG